MKLKYRGVAYDQSEGVSTLAVTEKEAIGRYRGMPCYRNHYALEAPRPAPYILKYRGVAYRPGVIVSDLVEAVPQQALPTTMTNRVQSLLNGEAVRQRAAYATHKSFLLKKLEHRMAVAQRQGNAQLMSLLETERAQLN